VTNYEDCFACARGVVMNKIKQNDEVIVIAGKDKGSVGTVTKVMGSKLIVEGLI